MSDIPPASEHLEKVEHAVHAAREGGLNAALVPLSITVMAVVAAVFGSLETTAASEAVLARSNAAVRQGEASDQWGFYQARSIKKNMYEIAAAQAGQDPMDGPRASGTQSQSRSVRRGGKPTSRAKRKPRRTRCACKRR